MCTCITFFNILKQFLEENLIEIIANGKNTKIIPGTNLQEFILSLNLPQGDLGIAACLNLEIVPKDDWTKHSLKDGDKLEIVEAAPGG